MLWSGMGALTQQTHKRTCPQPMMHTSPNKKRMMSRSSDKFMDDATLGTNNQTEPTECAHSTEQATMASQQWANLLKATGGSLDLKKEHWCRMHRKRDEGVPRMRSIHESEGEMRITNGPRGETRTMQRKPMTQEDLFAPETDKTVHAQRTLGVRPPPNGV